MHVRTFVFVIVAWISMGCRQAEHARPRPMTSGGAAGARASSEQVIVALGRTPGDDREYGDSEPAPLRTVSVPPAATPETEPTRHALDEGEPQEALGRAFVRARCERE